MVVHSVCFYLDERLPAKKWVTMGQACIIPRRGRQQFSPQASCHKWCIRTWFDPMGTRVSGLWRPTQIAQYSEPHSPNSTIDYRAKSAAPDVPERATTAKIQRRDGKSDELKWHYMVISGITAAVLMVGQWRKIHSLPSDKQNDRAAQWRLPWKSCMCSILTNDAVPHCFTWLARRLTAVRCGEGREWQPRWST